MNRIEYEHAVRKAKAARVWKNQDPNDSAARLAFERDFADRSTTHVVTCRKVWTASGTASRQRGRRHD